MNHPPRFLEMKGPLATSTKLMTIATSTKSTKTPRSAKSLWIFHYDTKSLGQTDDRRVLNQLRACPCDQISRMCADVCTTHPRHTSMPHIRVHACVRACVRACTCVQMHAYACRCVQMRAYVCGFVQMHGVSTYACVRMRAYACGCVAWMLRDLIAWWSSCVRPDLASCGISSESAA